MTTNGIEEIERPATGRINLGALYQEVSTELEQAAQRYHELRGQLALLHRMLADAQGPTVTEGEEKTQ